MGILFLFLIGILVINDDAGQSNEIKFSPVIYTIDKHKFVSICVDDTGVPVVIRKSEVMTFYKTQCQET